MEIFNYENKNNFLLIFGVVNFFFCIILNVQAEKTKIPASNKFKSLWSYYWSRTGSRGRVFLFLT